MVGYHDSDPLGTVNSERGADRVCCRSHDDDEGDGRHCDGQTAAGATGAERCTCDQVHWVELF